MLVLSRRPNEKVLFPSINTAVQVLSIKGGTVRLGIEAPPEVTILRAELQDRTAERGATTRLPEPAGSRLRGLRHLLRNRLNITTVGLGLLREQARAGLSDEMERTIAKIEEEMQGLQQRLESEAAQTPSQPPKPALRGSAVFGTWPQANPSVRPSCIRLGPWPLAPTAKLFSRQPFGSRWT